MGLKTEIWASKLEFEEGGMKEEKEKIPHLCESIGYLPLLGRCPKGDQLTDQPTNQTTLFTRFRVLDFMMILSHQMDIITATMKLNLVFQCNVNPALGNGTKNNKLVFLRNIMRYV